MILRVLAAALLPAIAFGLAPPPVISAQAHAESLWTVRDLFATEVHGVIPCARAARKQLCARRARCVTSARVEESCTARRGARIGHAERGPSAFRLA